MSVPERSFLAWVALVFVALASSSAMAQSASQSDDTSGEPRTARPKHKPVNLEIEAPSLDFMQDITRVLNDFHDEYRRFKKGLRRDYDLNYSMTVSIIPQWGMPDGGPGVVQMAYTPYVTWSRFTDTTVGSGSFSFAMRKLSSGRKPSPSRNKPGSV
jgi:hypothetical protein